MFILERREARAALRNAVESDGIVSRLRAKGYRPALREILDSAYLAAGLQRTPGELDLIAHSRYMLRRRGPENGPLGDVLFTNDCVFVLHPVQDRLRVWSIRHHRSESRIDAFCSDVAQAAADELDGRRLRGMSFDWQVEEAIFRSPRFSARRGGETKLKSKPAEYTQDDLVAAELLARQEVRAQVYKLAQLRGRARTADAAAEFPEKDRELLLQHGLVGKEYLLLCRQDSHTICTVIDRDHLTSGPLSDAKCPLCGRPFRDENIQEILTLTDRARGLTNGSHWMTVWVTERLCRAGVDLASISWNAASGEDEIDVVARIHGTALFLELKDREFGLGDAYPFLFRLDRYGGEQGAVITTDKVADEVKRLIEDRNSSSGNTFHTIEGLVAADRDIQTIVDRASRWPALQMVGEFSDELGFNFISVLVRWMDTASRASSVTREAA